jgi:hypothetical protein
MTDSVAKTAIARATTWRALGADHPMCAPFAAIKHSSKSPIDAWSSPMTRRALSRGGIATTALGGVAAYCAEQRIHVEARRMIDLWASRMDE